jgi:hypothetical protein
MSTATVRISVIDGLAVVNHCPRGIAVEVVDYDVDPRSADRDEAGRPCSRYSVTAADLERWAEAYRMARKYPGDVPLQTTPLVFKRRRRRAKTHGELRAVLDASGHAEDLFERGRAILESWKRSHA